jgi:hypothetical protein
MQQDAVEHLPVVRIRHRTTEQEMVVNLSTYLAGRDARYADWSLSSRHASVEPVETSVEARAGAALSVPPVSVPGLPRSLHRRRPRKQRKNSSKGASS